MRATTLKQSGRGDVLSLHCNGTNRKMFLKCCKDELTVPSTEINSRC